MAEYAVIESSQNDVLEQPAVKAWRKFGLGGLEPRRVVVLKPEKKKSAVYRIEGPAPARVTLIAKCGRLDRITLEASIYSDVLRHLPLRTLQYYGFIKDEDPRFGWLFLEDIGDERYSADNKQHRILAARWLGLLHISPAVRKADNHSLPNRSLDHFGEIVRLAHDTIQRVRSNPRLSPSDMAVLNAIQSHCEVLASHWGEVEEICHGMPQTLVHGDFSSKNVRMRSSPGGLEIFPLDWDGAGWGLAAPDLSQADVAAYGSVVCHDWPQLSIDAIRRVANVGKMFWALDPIRGELESLAGQWPGNAMRKMKAYETEIGSALEAEAWLRPFNQAQLV